MVFITIPHVNFRFYFLYFYFPSRDLPGPLYSGSSRDASSDSMAPRMIHTQAHLRLEARLEDLHVWTQKKVKDTKKGAKAYTYYLASWREGGKLRNVYLGSSQRMSREEAQEKAKALKKEALGLSLPLPHHRAVISCHENT